ncbi:hypothetical protein HOY82DRAFT_541412 [Tuber indicum]|nr:hypothetical protein HOY82DRAFT_541412 [Tuber indicum]
MEFENTFQVHDYMHIPTNSRTIQFTPGSITITLGPTEQSVLPNIESDDESTEEELEELERAGHTGELADHEEDGNEDALRGSRSGRSPGNSENESDYDKDEHYMSEGGQDSRNQYTRATLNVDPNTLPPPPNFVFFEHAALPHKRILHLPNTFSTKECQALDFFDLFFDDEERLTLMENTNTYARNKGVRDSHRRKRCLAVTNIYKLLGKDI